MGISDDIIWKCNAYSKGVEYANLEERVRKCEESKVEISSMTITMFPFASSRPRRLIRRHRP
jgi:hypothetical protein